MTRRFQSSIIELVTVFMLSCFAVPAVAADAVADFVPCIEQWDAPIYPFLAINGNLDGRFKLVIALSASGQLFEAKLTESRPRWLLFRKSIMDSLASLRAKPECFGATVSLEIYFELYPHGDFTKIQPSLTIRKPGEIIVRAMRREIIGD